MRARRYELPGRDAAAELRRARAGAAEHPRRPVAEIVEDVRARGDEAVLEWTERFDGDEPPARARGPESSRRRSASLDPAVRAGLELAIANVRAVAEAELRDAISVELPAGPAGRAPRAARAPRRRSTCPAGARPIRRPS